jgi:hypothetical protein
MSVYTPNYYSLPGGRFTNETTLGPIASTEAFYQERQNGLKCSLHSLNAFAGHNVVDFSALAKANNDFYIEKEHVEPDFVKQHLQLENIDDLDKRSSPLGAYAIAYFISQNKQLFHLPDTCRIEALVASPSFKKIPFYNAINYIDTHPSIHRVFAGSVDARHRFTCRKDASGQWRVIDSWSKYHTVNEQDPVKRLQPAFPTFQEAFEAHCARLGTNKGPLELVYPTEDAIPSVPPASSSSASNPISNTSTAENPKASSNPACCLVRLWNWIVARICALFCRRGSQ